MSLKKYGYIVDGQTWKEIRKLLKNESMKTKYH